MKIVLVHPTGFNWIPGKKDITTAANRMVPLGILSIASYLEKSGHNTIIYDCLGPGALTGNANHTRQILSHLPDIVGFSTTTSSFLDAYDIAERIKSKNDNIKIIFGGVHVSSLRSDLLKKYPKIDFLCPGEGEVTLSELANGEDYKSIDGLIWKEDDIIHQNVERKHIKNLDTLPFPAYEKLKGFPKGYNLPLFSYIKGPGATMVTSRGCPYKCTYCDRSVFKQGFRYNSAEYIYEHMKYLKKKFNVRHINIYDDLFTANKKRITELCQRLTRSPLGINFNCAVRVGHTDDDLLEMLKDAGCLMVSLGIESGDTEMLDRHKSGVTLEQVKETVDRIKKKKLRAKGLFMMGLPGETEESIIKTSDFVMSLGLDDMNMSKFTPFPGAPIWKTIHSEGDLEDDWRLMNCLNFVFIPKEIGSKEKLDQLYNMHVKRFYSDKEWRKKFKNRIWEHRKSIWHMMKNFPSIIAAKRAFESRNKK